MLSVCVSDVIGALAVWIQNQKKKNTSMEREPHPEAAISLRKMVTFVTWPSSRTEFLV